MRIFETLGTLGRINSWKMIVLIFFITSLIYIEGETKGFSPPPLNVSLTTDELDMFRSYIIVKWIPPSQPNIVSYNVLCGRSDGRTPNKTTTISAPTTSVRFNDLKPFANFTVFVRAYTKDGPGRWSEPATIQTPTGAPIIPCKLKRLFSPNSTTIFINWEPLLDYEYTNGVVIRWLVYAMDIIGGPVPKYWLKHIPVDILKCTITGLKPYHLYDVIVLPETKRLISFKKGMTFTTIRTMEDVPSHPPANLSSKMLCKEYALSIDWSPLQTQYRNGKLLGYKVMVNQDKTFYKKLIVNNEKVTIYLDECKNYSVQVAGMTSPGVGKYSRGNDVISSCKCGPPAPLYLRRTVVAKEGEYVSLPCEYQERPVPIVNWFRLVTNQRFPVTDMLINGTVVEMKDDGSYVCVLNNTLGAAETYVRLIVARDVVILNFQLIITNMEFTAELKDKTSRISRQLGLNITNAVLQKFKQLSVGNLKTIHVKGFSPGSVKVDLVLFATVDNTIEKKSTIKQIKDILAKTFYQSSMSVDGMQIGNLTLQVQPGSPLNIQITETKANSIQVTWSPPENHEIYVITSYSINHRKPNSKEWVKGNTLPVHRLNGLMDNLESSTEYEIMVAAYNKYGEGNSNILVVKTNADLAVPLILGIVIPVCLLMVIIGLYIWRKQRSQSKNVAQQLAIEQREKEVLERKKGTMFNLDVLLNAYEGSSDNVDKKWREIPRDSIEILGELGSGAFGQVKKAILNEDGGIICAVKMTKAQASKEETRDLLSELNIMASVGEHPNIVSLIGACSDEIPLWLIVKFAENGSLYEFLQSLASNDEPDNPSPPNITVLSYTDKLKLAFGIASGMAFLAQNRCVHRDLAARNVLLGKNNKPMVSDFGLSRDVYESGQYERTSGGRLPVRWMAIESLKANVFTVKSDVWSFGVVLWEIESLAKFPYIGLNGFDILTKLMEGYRLEKPRHCSQYMYDLMLECWKEDPVKRPQFKELVDKLERKLNDEGCEYATSVSNDETVQCYDEVIISE